MIAPPDLILGIDPSLTATGYCLLNRDGDVLELGTISKPKLKGILRLDAIEKDLIDLSRTYGLVTSNCMTVFEGYAMGAKGKVFHLGELGGILRLWSHRNTTYPYIEVPPSTLKKYATGNGFADKTEMVKLAGLMSIPITDDNQADAYFLAHLGGAYKELWAPLGIYNSKVISKG